MNYTSFKRAFVLMTDENYLFACGSLIVNILDKIKNQYSIIVIHSDLSLESKNILTSIFPNLILHEYNQDNFLSQFPFVSPEHLNSPYFKNYTYLNITKFRVLALLNEFDQIILMDTDMLLLDNLEDLLEDKVSNIIWKKDIGNIEDKLKNRNWHGDKKQLKIINHFQLQTEVS